jgi:branched-chain amino acid transport system permease protein
MAFLSVTLLNGLSYGLLLFMLSAGLTLIFSMMGVLNFAHASFYMLGAYLAYSISAAWGFWVALVTAPLLVACLGVLVERYLLRRVRSAGHLAELLLTFGLSYVVLELVQLVWGRGPVDYAVPAVLQGPMWTMFDAQFPKYRVFMMVIALVVLAGLRWVFTRTRWGLLLQAALTHPHMVQALGHDVPSLFTKVFGLGCALAALAGVLAGNAFVTEPGMATSIGALVFVVVVVGGLGSLEGAFFASILIGLLQTFAASSAAWNTWAPLLPYTLMVAILVWRPRGLMGRRGD